MVVALGERQADIIRESMDGQRLLDKYLDDWIGEWEQTPEPFEVKALEKVQGDERDVIIISIGFARNEQGVIRYQFGPINQDVGRRRLNVLITRARDKIVVVSSMRAGEMDVHQIAASGGMRLLRDYLDFAENGRRVLPAVFSWTTLRFNL